MPYLPEPSPVQSWICVVVGFPRLDGLGWGSRPSVEYGRLDVRVEDFAALPAAGRRIRDQVLHWTAVDAAAKRRTGA